MHIKYVRENHSMLHPKKHDCFFSSEKTKRGDTGKYELALRNAKGEVKIPIDVTVIGKIKSLIDIIIQFGVFDRSSR